MVPLKDKGGDSGCVTKCHKDVAVIFITSAIMELPREADIPSLKTQRLSSKMVRFFFKSRVVTKDLC